MAAVGKGVHDSFQVEFGNAKQEFKMPEDFKQHKLSMNSGQETQILCRKAFQKSRELAMQRKTDTRN